MVNWFARRGLVMGLWNSHTSVGNILGSLVAGAFVERDWALSFIIPGLIIIIMALPVLLFLVPRMFPTLSFLITGYNWAVMLKACNIPKFIWPLLILVFC